MPGLGLSGRVFLLSPPSSLLRTEEMYGVTAVYGWHVSLMNGKVICYGGDTPQ